MSNTALRDSRLTHSLGSDDIKVVRLEATEGLSQPFHFEVDVMAEDKPIDLLKHLGTTVTVSVYDGDTLLRHFHGVAVEGEFLHDTVHSSTGQLHYFYRLTLRPWAFVHEHSRNYRIFDKTPTKDILQKVLDDCGIAVDMKNLSGNYAVRPYCVQYGESDFGFASRLMEEEGIYYYYEHGPSQHTMILCDSPGAHKAGSATPLSYNPGMDFDADVTGEVIFATKWQERVATGAEKTVRLRDFDFKKSLTPLEKVVAATKEDHKVDSLEVYQFPGRFYEAGTGDVKANALLQSRRANRRIFTGESDATAISCGKTFELTDHSVDAYNANYLVTQTRHGIATETYRSSMGFAGDDGVWFEAVPAETLWRAPVTTRRPVVAGPETAIVIGDGGDNQVETDEFGRVKVLFHWDRNEGRNRDTWCWIRVSQIGHLGSIILPRIGQEVLVDFINGDPDRPIIVGRLFNKEHMPLYTLDELKSRAVWRSQTMGASDPKAGSYAADDGSWLAPGGNEITMEDRPGAEELITRAEHNMNSYVNNDYKREIFHDEIAKISNDQKETIGNDQTVEITNNQTIHAGNIIKITGDSQIQLICGGSKITMTPTGINIETTQLNVKASGMADINGGGQMTMKAGVIMIN